MLEPIGVGDRVTLPLERWRQVEIVAKRVPVERIIHPVERIIHAAAAEYGITVMHLRSDRRARLYSLARQTAMYLASEMTLHSLPQLGRRFGRDHTTIMHGIRQVKLRLEDGEDDTRERIEGIKARLCQLGVDHGHATR